MNGKIAAMLLMLIAVSFCADSECVNCDKMADKLPANIDLSLDEGSHMLNPYVYFESQTDGKRTPIRNTLLFINAMPEKELPILPMLLKTYTDEDGKAIFDFSLYAQDAAERQAAYTFKVVYCPFCCPTDENSEACFAECLKSAGIGTPIHTSAEVPLASGAIEPAIVNCEDIYLPTSAFVIYVPPPPPKDQAPAFCFPVIIIFALLAGALYYSGRNPFAPFTMASPHTGRHIRYNPGERGVSVSTTYIASQISSGAGEGKKMVAAAKDAKASNANMGGRERGSTSRPGATREPNRMPDRRIAPQEKQSVAKAVLGATSKHGLLDSLTFGVHGMLMGRKTTISAGPEKGQIQQETKGIVNTIGDAGNVFKEVGTELKSMGKKAQIINQQNILPDIDKKGIGRAQALGLDKKESVMKSYFKDAGIQLLGVFGKILGSSMFGVFGAGILAEKIGNWLQTREKSDVMNRYVDYLVSADNKNKEEKKLKEMGFIDEKEKTVLDKDGNPVLDKNGNAIIKREIYIEEGGVTKVYTFDSKGNLETAEKIRGDGARIKIPMDLEKIKDIQEQQLKVAGAEAETIGAYKEFDKAVAISSFKQMSKMHPELKKGIEEFSSEMTGFIDKLPVTAETKEFMKTGFMGELYTQIVKDENVIKAQQKIDTAKTAKEKIEAEKEYDNTLKEVVKEKTNKYVADFTSNREQQNIVGLLQNNMRMSKSESAVMPELFGMEKPDAKLKDMEKADVIEKIIEKGETLTAAEVKAQEVVLSVKDISDMSTKDALKAVRSKLEDENPFMAEKEQVKILKKAEEYIEKAQTIGSAYEHIVAVEVALSTSGIGTMSSSKAMKSVEAELEKRGITEKTAADVMKDLGATVEKAQEIKHDQKRIEWDVANNYSKYSAKVEEASKSFNEFTDNFSGKSKRNEVKDEMAKSALSGGIETDQYGNVVKQGGLTDDVYEMGTRTAAAYSGKSLWALKPGIQATDAPVAGYKEELLGMIAAHGIYPLEPDKVVYNKDGETVLTTVLPAVDALTRGKLSEKDCKTFFNAYNETHEENEELTKIMTNAVASYAFAQVLKQQSPKEMAEIKETSDEAGEKMEKLVTETPKKLGDVVKPISKAIIEGTKRE